MATSFATMTVAPPPPTRRGGGWVGNLQLLVGHPRSVEGGPSPRDQQSTSLVLEFDTLHPWIISTAKTFKHLDQSC